MVSMNFQAQSDVVGTSVFGRLVGGSVSAAEPSAL